MNALNSILSYVQRPGSIKTLEGLGIQVFADETKTQFRNVLEIFQDIAVNWNTLSADIQNGFVQAADDAGLFNEEMAAALGQQEQWNDLQQRDISQAAAGVYRRNYFIGMIERLANVQGVLNNMMDAEGYSMAENAKTMETLEKQSQSLQASMEALSVAMGDAGVADSLKVLANGGTAALNAITGFDPAMRDLILGFGNTFIALKTLQLGMKTFGITLPGISALVGGLTTGMTGLKGAVTATTASLKAFAVANAPLAVFAALTAAAVALYNHFKKLREEQERFIETTRDNIKNLDEERRGLETLAQEYETLKEKQENLTATADEKKRLLEIQKQLVEQYEVSVTGINAEGQAYADSAEAIQMRINALKELQAIEQSNLESAVMSRDTADVKALDENIRKRIELQDTLLEKQKEIDRYMSALQSGGTMTVSAQGYSTVIDASTESGARVIRQYIENTSREKSALQLALNETNLAIQEGTKDRQQLLKEDAVKTINQLTENGVIVSDEARAYAIEFAAALSQVPKDIFSLRDDMQKAINEFVTSDFQKFSESYKKAVAKGDTEKIDEASSSIMNLIQEFSNGIPELDSWALAMEGIYINSGQLSESTSKATEKTVNMRAVMEGMAITTRSALSELKVLNQAMYDVSQGQALSAETVLDLIEKYDMSEVSIQAVADGYMIELDSLEKLRQVKIKATTEELENQKQVAEVVMIQTQSRLESYGLEIEQIKNLAEARAILARQADKYASDLADGLVGSSFGATYKKAYDEYLAQSGADLKAYEKALADLEQLNSMAAILSDPNAGVSKSSTKKSGSTNQALSDAIRILEHRKRISEETISSIQSEITELNRINAAYAKTSEERMDMAERIYAAEKRLRDMTLQQDYRSIDHRNRMSEQSAELIQKEIDDLILIRDTHKLTAEERMNIEERLYSVQKNLLDARLKNSVNWINQEKEFNRLSIEEEIAAWERVRINQADNAEAVKQANLNIYKLKQQVMDETYSKEENLIQHLTKLGVYGIQQQIDKYEELYAVKASSLEEEYRRTENLFSLYKNLLSDQQKAIKSAYDERMKQIDDEAKARKALQDDVIKGIEAELKLLERQEQSYSHEQKMADLKEQLAYWSVRTSEDARKKVAELTEQIAEAEREREVELKKQQLEDKKQIAQDEIKAIDDAAQKEKENWEKSYKLVEKAFDDHSTNIVALAATMSKEAYWQWENNYLIPLQNALFAADFGSFDSIANGLQDSLNDLPSYSGPTPNTLSENSLVYQAAKSIVDLKRQYEVGGDKTAAKRAVSYYDELSSLRPNVADQLHQMSYEQAAQYISTLPQMHSGGKTLSYGAVYMKPGEITFPPDLSTKLESLISALYTRPLNNVGYSTTDNSRKIQIGNLLNIERNYMEDDIDSGILSRDLQRAVLNIL